MSKVQTLRAFINQRLSAAAEEIFELFERSISEYEETLSRQQKLLDAVFKPEVRLHSADVQVLLVNEEEVPAEQQEWSCGLDQEDSAVLPLIKEEQGELWTSQEGEQHPALEDDDITKSTLTSIPVKSEGKDEEKPQSSQLHLRQTCQMRTEADGEDCGEPEADGNSDRHLQPDTNDKTSDFSNHGSDDCYVWKKSSKPQSGLNSRKNNRGCEKTFGCSECGKQFSRNFDLKIHMRIHTGEKPFCCAFCGRRFTQRSTLTSHLSVHTGGKHFKCRLCKAGFSDRFRLFRHMRSHTEEKPFSC